MGDLFNGDNFFLLLKLYIFEKFFFGGEGGSITLFAYLLMRGAFTTLQIFVPTRFLLLFQSASFAFSLAYNGLFLQGVPLKGIDKNFNSDLYITLIHSCFF